MLTMLDGQLLFCFPLYLPILLYPKSVFFWRPWLPKAKTCKNTKRRPSSRTKRGKQPKAEARSRAKPNPSVLLPMKGMEAYGVKATKAVSLCAWGFAVWKNKVWSWNIRVNLQSAHLSYLVESHAVWVQRVKTVTLGLCVCVCRLSDSETEIRRDFI